MGRFSLFLWLGLLGLWGCRAARQVPVASTRSDSVRVSVRVVERMVRDTVVVTVPAQRDSVSVRDSSSWLENDWARSFAAVGADGLLRHALWAKAGPRAVATARVERSRDTVVVRRAAASRDVVVRVPFEPSGYERAAIGAFPWLLCLLLLILGVWLARLWQRSRGWR